MDEDESQIPVFRAVKRRKIVVRPARAASHSPESTPTSPQPRTADSAELSRNAVEADDDDSEQERDAGALASALRARQALKKGRFGRPVVASAAALQESLESQRQRPQEMDDGVLEASGAARVYEGRFAKPTGVVADVTDSAMTAYIDSRIRDMKVDQERLEHQQQKERNRQADEPKSALAKPREAVAAGRLQEIDLGPTSTHQNLLRTQAATDRLEMLKSNNGIDPAAEPVGRNGKKLKPRKGLGPDGKPWRPRKPRRTSDDLKRDAMVESFMSAAPIEVFDKSSGTASGVKDQGNVENTDKDADELMLEQFQQDYYNAETNRRARKPPPVKGKEADAAKTGPRLGGSRSARAAMYKKQQEESQQKKPGN